MKEKDWSIPPQVLKKMRKSLGEEHRLFQRVEKDLEPSYYSHLRSVLKKVYPDIAKQLAEEIRENFSPDSQEFEEALEEIVGFLEGNPQDTGYYTALGATGLLSDRSYTREEVEAALRQDLMAGSIEEKNLTGVLFWAGGEYYPEQIRQKAEDYQILYEAVKREWGKL